MIDMNESDVSSEESDFHVNESGFPNDFESDTTDTDKESDFEEPHEQIRGRGWGVVDVEGVVVGVHEVGHRDEFPNQNFSGQKLFVILWCTHGREIMAI